MLSSAEILEIRERQPRSVALNAVLNMEGIKAAVTRITGHQCHSLTKKAEGRGYLLPVFSMRNNLRLGGFHRIYFAHCADDTEFVVRVAFDITDFRGSRKMESEVATITWLGANTQIPVPKIIFYDATCDNELNAPYMLMEKIQGTTLARKWVTMTLQDKELSIKALANIVVELLNTKFDAIGSLYPPSNALGPMMPTCNPWCFRKDLDLDRGPWNSEREYLLACISRERSWLLAHEQELEEKWASQRTAFAPKSLRDGYRALYDSLTDYVSKLEIDTSDTFILRHPDLNPPNIMVSYDDPSKLTIIDWECASTAPLWSMARTPDFIADDSRDPDNAHLRSVFHTLLPGRFADAATRSAPMLHLEEACQLMCSMRDPEKAKDIVERALKASN